MCIDEELCFLIGWIELGEESFKTFFDEPIADFLNLEGDNGLAPFSFQFDEWITDVAFLVFPPLPLDMFLWVTERDGPSWTDELSPE